MPSRAASPSPGDRVETVVAAVSEALADALSLVLPVWCAGCDASGRTLCRACAAVLQSEAATHRTVGGLSVRSALRFEGVAARAIRALKEDGRTSLARPLGALLPPLVRRAGWDDAVLVPLPTSRAAFRRRGYAVPELLARRSGLTSRRMLRAGGSTADQRLLSADERARNVRGTITVRGALPDAPLVLLDDVVTTGATLGEARRALESAGGRVVGAVTVAETPRRFSPAVRQ